MPVTMQRHRAVSVRTLLSAVRTEVLFCPFPQSVLLQIIDLLSRHSLVTLLRVNSAFYWITLPILYQQVILTTGGPWPRFNTVIKLPPKGDFRSWLERNPLTSRVKQVDVLPHSSRRCMVHHFSLEADCTVKPPTHNCPGRLPDLPHLKLLRVHVNPGSGLHHDEKTRFASDANDGPGLVPQCAVVHNLRPRKLVLLGGPSVSSSSGLTSLPYAVLAAAEEYVLILYPDLELQEASKTSPLPLLRAGASCARHATIIFHPHTPWDEFKCGLGVKAELSDSWAGRFIAELGRQISQLGDGVKVNLINAGSLDHGALGMDAWDAKQGVVIIENHFREAFRREQRASYTSRRRVFIRTNQIEFVDMAEYLKGGREDELGAARLQEWLHPGAQTPRRRGPTDMRIIPPTPPVNSPGQGTPSGSRIAAAAQAAARRCRTRSRTRSRRLTSPRPSRRSSRLNR